MEKTMKIEGMMCAHCEARVKKCSHEAGTAVVKLNAETADEVLRKAVEDQDYKVTGIQ